MTNTVVTYQGLVTSEHQQSPNFLATVALSVQPMVDIEALLAGMGAQFDLDAAIGAQLDVVGQWVGQSRNISVPLSGVYFQWGGTGPGWGIGSWKGLYDPAAGLTALDDATYRLLLRGAILANHWDGTTAGANAVMAAIFNSSTTPGTVLWIDDGMNMTMTFVLSGQTPTAVFQALLKNGFVSLRPAGVLANYVKSSIPGDPVFAWSMSNSLGAGWGSGAWATPL